MITTSLDIILKTFLFETHKSSGFPIKIQHWTIVKFHVNKDKNAFK